MTEKYFYLHGKKCHLVGKLRDGNDVILIYKTWSTVKKRWSYFSELEAIILNEIGGVV